MDRKTLKLIAESPREFRRRLLIPCGNGSALLGDVMADFQAKDFKALDAGFVALQRRRLPRPINRYWLERTKGASKDSDLAVMILWLLAFSSRSLACQVGAADQDQANELRKAALDIYRLNPWLSGMVDIQTTAIINHSTGSRCDILTADESGSHGARPHLVILNELTHISKREFAATLMDNAAKVPGAIVVIATNAGHVDTWQEEWRRTAQEGERWYFSAYTEPAPWLDPQEIKEAERRGPPQRYLRLWRGQWVAKVGSALRADDIAAAVTQTGPLKHPERGWLYYGGLDLGLTRDASSLVITGRHVGFTETLPKKEKSPWEFSTMEALADVGALGDVPQFRKMYSGGNNTIRHHGSGRYKLAAVYVWRPGGGRQVSLEEIEEAIVAAHRRFGLTVGADPYQAAYLIQRLQKQGVPIGSVDFTPANLKGMATTTLEAFSERQIDLFSDPTLLADLRALKAAERGYGVRLESPRIADGNEVCTRHGDTATALSIALHVANQHPGALPLDRPLIVW